MLIKITTAMMILITKNIGQKKASTTYHATAGVPSAVTIEFLKKKIPQSQYTIAKNHPMRSLLMLRAK